MGILTSLLGTNSTSDTFADHRINPANVLAPTDNQALNPRNPGPFGSVRSTPVLNDPRYFNKEEVQALKSLARERKSSSKYTQQAFNALQQIDDADVEVHAAFYQYRQHLAGNEVQKLAANTKYAEALHGLRPRYVSLGAGIDGADYKASFKIQQLKQKMQQQRAA
ncbi:MAG: hypothetical protein HC825_00030 [Oscillatoriales cyanobacterium RM1_1_9]|nr:hypothetical protein [Oscillatoriales cyanobacterium SM2_3_0]NJO45689.1 hypothetical protein [Oscillatoriales cyanobacterium RM2_1_1]NJO70519.1 hypothetical protein [Oscillatoriales cyanobacterium RM1_1_9]